MVSVRASQIHINQVECVEMDILAEYCLGKCAVIPSKACSTENSANSLFNQ